MQHMEELLPGYINPEEEQKTRYHGIRDRVVWMLLLPGPDQSMTLLPDSWGPLGGCGKCGAVWSHVTRLGTLVGGGLGMPASLKQHRTDSSLYALLEQVTCSIALAEIECTEGHRSVVYSDGLVEQPRHLWGAGIPWETGSEWSAALTDLALCIGAATYGIAAVMRGA